MGSTSLRNVQVLPEAHERVPSFREESVKKATFEKLEFGLHAIKNSIR